MDSTAQTPQTPPAPTIPLDVTDQQNAALLDDTLKLLNGGVPDQNDKHGLAEIDRWIEVLRASERTGLAKILQELNTLRNQLGEADTEPHAIAETLAILGAETNKVADESNNHFTASLNHLGKVLIKLGSSLSR
ncbi:hypothetical protein SAMN00120144_2094 [Hymenobacter roseosalivarius DSM 11622]|uniref:Uncharacterized protein n=1 Tax=Hymenobacter roseosalivarius DSM 11622 TaxID=645990 RepID=A0A1W1VPN9_9BACT|nr:hypothetical protein [Hymenobacter roseosalivarius]SMB94874.1 hypothetical protein SAMN00120144_2094 [Hymenobacter roseosalivarius DSM 11622]